MTQLNTTFYVHSSVQTDFLEWVRGTYIPAALDSGLFRSPQLMLVEHQVEPDALTYAVQFMTHDTASARLWHDEGNGASLRRDAMERYPQKLLFFSSFMEVLPL